MTDSRPPCWPDRAPCPNPCARAHYERTVHNHHDLTGPEWAGWRFRGRDFVSPDGVRINAERMRGIIWRQEQEARRDAAVARNRPKKQLVRVVVIDLDTYRLDGIAAS